MAFLPYKNFFDKEHALAFSEMLTQHKIPFELAEERESFDATFAGKRLGKGVILKLQSADFAKADELMLRAGDINLEDIDKDHYIFSFSDEELFEILQKPDEWSATDYQLAQKILKQRGKEVPAEGLRNLKEKRIRELSKPDDGTSYLVYSGFLGSMLGGVLGILIGWHVFTYRKTLPDGSQVYGYSAKDRKAAKVLMVVSAIFFAGFVYAALTKLTPF